MAVMSQFAAVPRTVAVEGSKELKRIRYTLQCNERERQGGTIDIKGIVAFHPFSVNKGRVLNEQARFV